MYDFYTEPYEVPVKVSGWRGESIRNVNLRVGYYTYNHAGSIFQVDLVGIVATGDFALKQFKEWAEAYDHFERLASLLWDIEDKGFPPIKVSSPPSTSAITNRDAREMGDPTLAD